MANAIYALSSDNIANSVTPTVQSGTVDTGYPAANLVNLNPALPGKLTTTTGAWLWDFGAPTSVQLAAIIHHNLSAGLNVRLQGNATDSWGTPSLDQAFTIPAYQDDGFPVNPFLDLSALVNTYRYWRLVVVGVNTAAVAIGEVVLASTKRTLTVNYSWGARRREEHPLIEHRTDYGVSSIYSLGTKWRSLEGELDTTDAGATAFLALARASRGRAKPWLFVPDGAVNDAWFVRFKDARTIDQVLQFVDRHTLPFAVEEVSRGLVL